MNILLFMALVAAFCSGGLFVVGISAADKSLKTLSYCMSAIGFVFAIWLIMQ